MEIKDELCAWFVENRRDLIFRKTKNPYSIWVSEIMAQQTRIDTMIPYYERWMKEYPTVEALANAPIEKVLKSWEGLGYYNRARKLHEGANQVVREYDGELPNNVEELLKIAGIGPYTAGAIASIAFQQEAPAIDGNVLRVITRFLEIEDDISKPKTVSKVYKIVKEFMKGSNPSDFTEGLMELGALICTPTGVHCDQCPLQRKCKSFAHQTQMNYPVKTKSKKAPSFMYKTLIIVKNKKILLSKDDRDGLMKGLIRLPQFEEFDVTGYQLIKNSQHVYSHKIWKMEVYRFENGKIPTDDDFFWVSLDEVKEHAIIGAHLKLLKEIMPQLFE